MELHDGVGHASGPTIRHLSMLCIVACASPSPTVVVDNHRSETRPLIDRFVAAGRTPEAFLELASDLRTSHHDVAGAVDAEIRLLALAVPYAEADRSQANQSSDRYALTVWPVLLSEPINAAPTHDLRPRTNETAAEYVARICELLQPGLAVTNVSDQRLVVRAAAIHQASRRMHEALSRCVGCTAYGTQSEWDRFEHQWESLDEDAQAMLRDLAKRELHEQQALLEAKPSFREAH